MSARQERARYIRYGAVGILVLIDLFALPWALFFLLVVKLHGMAHAPKVWLHSLSLFGGSRGLAPCLSVVGLAATDHRAAHFPGADSWRGLSGGYDPEGDSQAAGNGQFGSSRWQTKREIDWSFDARKF